MQCNGAETAQRRQIGGLLDELEAAVSSPANATRQDAAPRACFGVEEPIAWTRLFGFDANRYFSDPGFYVEQTLRHQLWRWRTFPLDQAPLAWELPAWLGHYPEFTYAGMNVWFMENGVPLLQEDHPLRRSPDLSVLRPVDFLTTGWMPRVLRWYDDISRLVEGRIPVSFAMTWWRGCLDLATQLRGYEALMEDAAERPQFVDDLLRFLVEERCRWWEAYEAHFGLPRRPAFVGDDWINVPFISPRFFERFVLPRYLEIEAFHGGLSGIHSCGNQTPLQRHLLRIESLRMLEVSPWTDLETTLRNAPEALPLGISLHPNDVLCAEPGEMEAQLRRIAEMCRGRAYNVGTSGLTPIRDGAAHYVGQIRAWTEVADRVMRAEREARAPSA